MTPRWSWTARAWTCWRGVAGADWGAIEPSIFGTLFERSLDPDKRSQLGAHYTSKEDILLIVEPVLMAPLRRRWAEVKAEAEVEAEKRDNARGQKRATLDKKLQDCAAISRPSWPP